MKIARMMWLIFIFQLIVFACSLFPNGKPSEISPTQVATVEKARGDLIYENDRLSMSYPKSWRTIGEIFGKPPVQTREKEFNSDILITVTNGIANTFGEKYTAWCSLMRKDSTSSIQEQMDDVYTFLENYPNSELSRSEIRVNGMNAFENVYKRPRGEPWYKVRDVWIPQKNDVIILSCYSYPDSFDKNNVLFQKILKSIRIKPD